MARRIPRLSTAFRRTLAAIRVRPNTAPYQAVFAAIGSLEHAEPLPGPVDFQTRFAPGRAYVRRVSGHNVWILYRFDADHVFVITARAEPPVPGMIGPTETFSVSVDPKTKEGMRALANRDFGGNLSALVADLAEEARRRIAADAYLRRHGMSRPSVGEAEAIEKEIRRELALGRSAPKSGK